MMFFPLCMLSRYDDVAERNIYGLAYQLGGIRKAFLNLKKEEDKNHFTKNKSPRHYFSESILKSFAKSIFVKDKDLNIENLIKLFSKDELNYFHETSGSEELDIIKLNSYLRENSYYDKSNSFIHHISDFNKNNVYSYWENIRGHDLTLICSTILDILIKSPTQIDDFIVNHCEPNNFKKTHLYKRLCNVGLLVNE